MGRPLKEIDWEVVEKYMQAGCKSGATLARKFDMQNETFYKRFKDHYGCSIQDYQAGQEEIGEAELRMVLHEKALDNDAPGNTTLLMFLARCRLGMKEPETVHLLAANQEQIDQSHVIMQLQHENEELKKHLKGYELVQHGLEQEVDKLHEENSELTGWG
jgi:hypothetical protein